MTQIEQKHKIGTWKGPVDDKHAERTREKYEQLIEPLRAAARELGYAIAVHGSLRRDIDLIAVPWTETASDARTLMEALKATVLQVTGYAELSWYMDKGPEFTLDGAPGNKPHGRLAWVINYGGSYIDLSVMPRMETN